MLATENWKNKNSRPEVEEYSEFLSATIQYAKKSIIDQINGSNNVISCNEKFAYLFCNLMKDYPSIRELLICEFCGHKEEQTRCQIPIPNTNIIIEHNYTTLQQEVEEYFTDRIVFCRNCESTSARLSSALDTYLCIDVEDSYKRTLNPEMKDFNQIDIYCSLDQVPIKINIQRQTFHLCGVARYTLPVVAGGTGHYIAYCRKINGTWEEKNDMLTYKKCISEHQTKVLKMKMSMLFYVQYM